MVQTRTSPPAVFLGPSGRTVTAPGRWDTGWYISTGIVSRTLSRTLIRNYGVSQVRRLLSSRRSPMLSGQTGESRASLLRLQLLAKPAVMIRVEVEGNVSYPK